jgi:hypothetical protein
MVGRAALAWNDTAAWCWGTPWCRPSRSGSAGGLLFRPFLGLKFHWAEFETDSESESDCYDCHEAQNADHDANFTHFKISFV